MRWWLLTLAACSSAVPTPLAGPPTATVTEPESVWLTGGTSHTVDPTTGLTFVSHGRHIYAVERDGRATFRFWNSFDLAGAYDVDDDGIAELLLHGTTARVVDAETGVATLRAPEGCGDLRPLVPGEPWVALCDEGTRVVLRHLTGHEIVSLLDPIGLPLVAQLDADPALELVLSHGDVIDGETHAVEASFPTRPWAALDVGADGVPDALWSTGLLARQSADDPGWAWSTWAGQDFDGVLADLDGDGEPSWIVQRTVSGHTEVTVFDLSTGVPQASRRVTPRDRARPAPLVFGAPGTPQEVLMPAIDVRITQDGIGPANDLPDAVPDVAVVDLDDDGRDEIVWLSSPIVVQDPLTGERWTGPGLDGTDATLARLSDGQRLVTPDRGGELWAWTPTDGWTLDRQVLPSTQPLGRLLLLEHDGELVIVRQGARLERFDASVGAFAPFGDLSTGSATVAEPLMLDAPGVQFFATRDAAGDVALVAPDGTTTTWFSGTPIAASSAPPTLVVEDRGLITLYEVAPDGSPIELATPSFLPQLAGDRAWVLQGAAIQAHTLDLASYWSFDLDPVPVDPRIAVAAGQVFVADGVTPLVQVFTLPDAP